MFASARVGEVEECGDPYLVGSNPAIYQKTKDLPDRKSFVFVAKLGFVVRLVLVAMTVALQHLATAHPHSPLPSKAWGGPLLGGFESSNLSKNERPPRREVFRFVAKLGFEPRQTEPESVVLPLHHLAKPKGN